MEIDVITQLISTLGFPIAACIYMAYSGERTRKDHKEEVSKVTEAINEMRVAITALTESLRK